VSETKIKLLEDRVLQTVAQVRALKDERDRAESELRELHRRLGELEREGELARVGLPPERVGEIRGVLEAAIRVLREDGTAATRQAEREA